MTYLLAATDLEDDAWTELNFDDTGWLGGEGAVGAVASPSQSLRIPILADSRAEWSPGGQIGRHGWVYGYYRQEGDSDGAYHHGRDFVGTDPEFRFSGGAWTLAGGDSFPGIPEVVRITADEMACIPSLPRTELWAVRRWISSHTGTVVAEVSLTTPDEGPVPSVRLVHNGHIVFDSHFLRDADGDRPVFIQLEIGEGDAIDLACVAPASSPPLSLEMVAVPVAIRIIGVSEEPQAVADSLADWDTAEQGENGWEYGVYHYSEDADRSYSTTEFVNDAPEWSFLGGSWQLGTSANPAQRPPWDRISRDSVHPGVYPSGVARWVIRRWTSDFHGDTYARVIVRKLARGGNGVTARVFHNGVNRWSYSIPGQESEGLVFLVPLGPVEVGDLIDFAIDPLGTDGKHSDSVDGTACSLTVQPGSLDGGDVALSSLVQTPLPEADLGEASSVLLRYPFEIGSPQSVAALILRMRHSAGFHAYLNGTPVAAVGETNGEARTVSETLAVDTFDLSASAALLRPGANVLAIRAFAPPGVVTPFLLAPGLVASRHPHAPMLRLAARQPLDAALPVASLTGRCTDPDGAFIALVGIQRTQTTQAESALGIARGFVRYTPPPGFSGEDDFAYVVANSSGLTATGRVVVEVSADTDPPRARSAQVTDGGGNVVIRYSEPIDPEVAALTGGYVLDPPADILEAAPSGDGTSVLLSLDGLAAGAGTMLHLTVEGQRDRSGNAMPTQTLPVGQNEAWPPIPDPTPYIPDANLFFVPFYHATRYTYGEYLGQHSSSGDYLNMGRWVDFPSAAFDDDGVPLYSYQGQYYNPTRVQLHCLSMYGKHVRGEESPDRFLKGVERLLTLQDERGAFLYPFNYVHHFLDTPLTAGWTSALAQGFGLSVLSRAYLITGELRYLEAGEAALDYLLTPVESGGPATTLADLDPSLESLMWLEEWPVSPTPYTLNGFTFTLLSLYDWSQLPGDLPSSATASAAFDRGMDTLEVIAPYFDAGGYTTYDLRHMVTSQRPFFAGAYQAVHVGTVNALCSISHSRALQDMELLWASQVERPTKMVVEAPKAGRVGESLEISAWPEYGGNPVPKGTDKYSDVLGDVLIDGLTLAVAIDRIAAGTGATGEEGHAEVAVTVPARYGAESTVPLDVTFAGWAEYQASARRVELAVTGSGELNLETAPGAGYVKLLWEPPAVEWNHGFRLYRAEGSGGAFVLLADGAPLQAETSAFIDWTASPGTPYRYRITTVGADVDDSDFSPAVESSAGEPPRLRAILEADPARVEIRASGLAGEVYILERSIDLETWERVRRTTAGPEAEPLAVEEPLSESPAIYRVRLDP